MRFKCRTPCNASDPVAGGWISLLRDLHEKGKANALVGALRAGCVVKPKRWSGDTHSDSECGYIDDVATDALMAQAADLIEQRDEVIARYEKCFVRIAEAHGITSPLP